MTESVQTSRPASAEAPARQASPTFVTGEKIKVGAWEWTHWPTFFMPTQEWLRAYGQAKGARAIDDFHRQREQFIAQEQFEPLAYGWEQPPVAVVRALLAGTYVPGTFGTALRPQFRQEFKANDLVLLGGNGSGKSEVQAKIGVEVLTQKENREWRAFSQNEDTSIRYIQTPTNKYLPSNLRKIKKQGQTTKISFSEATGFSMGRLILPNHSAAFFPTYKGYQQDPKSVEGGEADIATWDEEAPSELLRTLRFRVHKKGGFLLGGFTPVGGYTDTVGEYIEGGTVLETIPARLVEWDWLQRGWKWGAWLLPPEQELVKGCPPGHVPFVIQSGGGGGRRFAVTLPTMFNPYTNVQACVEGTAAGEYLKLELRNSGK